MRPPPSIMVLSETELIERVLGAYASGWFPMYEPEAGVLHWCQPRVRGIIPLDERFTVSRSLRAKVRRGVFRITSDRAFGEVIRACGEPGPKREVTWLNPEIIHIFETLHRAGLAHSVEAWNAEGVLVGGLYGLALGGVFCGESMFSRPALGGTDASKVCLVHLVEHLRRSGFAILDAQMTNPHLAQFGMYDMPQRAYVAFVRKHLEHWPEWGWGEEEKGGLGA